MQCVKGIHTHTLSVSIHTEIVTNIKRRHTASYNVSFCNHTFNEQVTCELLKHARERPVNDEMQNLMAMHEHHQH